MGDSPDIFGDGPEHEDEKAPSAAELEAAGQAALFGAPEPVPAPVLASNLPWEAPLPPVPPVPVPAAVAAAPPREPYRVLARKYRPQTFAELIGQEPMVQTLANAIRRGRLAHAFLMTGVRGVGKTSTARLIAKALNCIGPDGHGGSTIDPCGQCEPCRAIAEGRHIDVIEMDAASHTGIDDVREIIEAVRYAAVSARYKIYIIDEVHMLSRQAFNGLLKTLEEPPAHVKFLFATTEADKLPVTVLSRCQRFDLRRIETPLLASHFAWVCEQEGVEAEAEALAMIAAAAEGSVRDGLSILDQAIAHADMEEQSRVTAAKVRDMLGLADKSVRRALFAALLAGEGKTLLDLVETQFSYGVEPLGLLRAALELTHRVTVAQVGAGVADATSAEERADLDGWARALSAGQLHRLWQLLLKGYEEVRSAPDPLVAAQMALLRVMHATDMPDPGDLVRKLEEIAARGPVAASGDSAGKGQDSPAAAAPVAQWAALVDRIDHAGEMALASMMRMQVRVVDLAPGRLRFAQPPEFRENIAAQLKAGLARVSGDHWDVERVEGEGAPTLVEAEARRRSTEAEALMRAPLVEATFAAFPDAELVEEEQPAGHGGRRQWRH